MSVRGILNKDHLNKLLHGFDSPSKGKVTEIHIFNNSLLLLATFPSMTCPYSFPNLLFIGFQLADTNYQIFCRSHESKQPAHACLHHHSTEENTLPVLFFWPVNCVKHTEMHKMAPSRCHQTSPVCQARPSSLAVLLRRLLWLPTGFPLGPSPGWPWRQLATSRASSISPALSQA